MRVCTILTVSLLAGCGGQMLVDDGLVEAESLSEGYDVDALDAPDADDDSDDAADDDAFAKREVASTYQNPIERPHHCADPGVLRDGSDYYLVCTASWTIRHSTDLVSWQSVGALFDAAPSWVDTRDPLYWAPEIHKVGERYVAYYVARSRRTGKASVGAAWSSTPRGPFNDKGEPLVEGVRYGAIDPTEYSVGNRHYLYWKRDSNGHGVPIYAQALSADGLSRVGATRQVLHDSLHWEDSGGPLTQLIEAPWLMQHGRYFYLFYSGNGYATAQYAVGVARSKFPDRGFKKKGPPILRSNGVWEGPGHNSVVRAGNHDFIINHAWDAAHSGRFPLLDRIRWKHGWPTVNNGTPSYGNKPLP